MMQRNAGNGQGTNMNNWGNSGSNWTMDGQQNQDQWQMGNMNMNSGSGLQSWQMENQRRLAATKVTAERRGWRY